MEWTSLSTANEGTIVSTTVIIGTTENDGIYRSQNAGSSWELVKDHTAGKSWTSVALARDEPLRVYATQYPGYVWRSDDQGETWVPFEVEKDWLGVCSSDDGLKAGFVPYFGFIFLYDFVSDEVHIHELENTWTAIAMNSDGSIVTAVADPDHGGVGGKYF